MHNGYPIFEWASGEPIIDVLDEDIGPDYPTFNILNDPDAIN